MLHAAYSIYLRLVTRLRESPDLHRSLFGYRPVPESAGWGAYWDWTTLALKQALRRHLRPGLCFLDMGTGSVGVLAIYAALRLRCRRVVGIDCIPALTELAALNARAAGASAEFLQGDLFSPIKSRFDVIAFNAPYLEATKARELGLLDDPMSVQRFDGGQGGTRTIRRFLAQAPRHLAPGGVVLLGVSHFHAPRTAVLETISSCPLALIKCHACACRPGSVYVLGVAEADHEGTQV